MRFCWRYRRSCPLSSPSLWCFMSPCATGAADETGLTSASSGHPTCGTSQRPADRFHGPGPGGDGDGFDGCRGGRSRAWCRVASSDRPFDSRRGDHGGDAVDRSCAPQSPDQLARQIRRLDGRQVQTPLLGGAAGAGLHHVDHLRAVRLHLGCQLAHRQRPRFRPRDPPRCASPATGTPRSAVC